VRFKRQLTGEIMSKAKAQTIQQRLGFMDTDLKSSKHDEIMLWLDDAVEKHFNQMVSNQQEWEYREFSVIENEKEIRDLQREIIFNDIILPKKPELEVVKRVWEYPITTTGRGSYIVGFADMRVDYLDCSLTYYVKDNKFQIYKENKSLFFEVKSDMPSLGELIRQIRMYQTYTSGKWFVVSPDSRMAAVLEKQSIYFIRYEPERFVPDEAIGPDGTKYKIPIK